MVAPKDTPNAESLPLDERPSIPRAKPAEPDELEQRHRRIAHAIQRATGATAKRLADFLKR